jgi:hypothetical protein
LRAGPLSDGKIIETLNGNFVNTWVLNRRLEALKNQASDPNTRLLAKAVFSARVKGSPVDSLVFSPQLELIARQPANDLLLSYREARSRYQSFLTSGLEKLKRWVPGDSRRDAGGQRL